MQRIYSAVRAHSYFLWIWGILIAAILLRAYSFQSRIGIGGDSGRDAMIAQIALSRHELPLFGSFSSAGPFVFGPLFYWVNMIAYLVNPLSLFSPWLLTFAIGVLTVMVLTYLGFLIGGKKLAVVTGLLAAFSPQFTARSTFLSQHGFVGITTSLVLVFFVLYMQKRKLIFAFLSGISLGAALSMHYQTLNLVIFLPAILLVPKTTVKKRLLAFLLMFFGFIIPSIPLLYWDSRQSFANTKNILDYIFIGQYRLYVPNSWKLYLFKYLPEYWCNVVGGNIPFAMLLMVLSGVSFILAAVKRKLTAELCFLGSIFFILLVVIRYYRGERFEGYLIYIAPFIFLFTAWGIVYFTEVLKSLKNSLIGKFAWVVFFVGIMLLTLIFDFDNVSQFLFFTYNQVQETERAANFLQQKFPHEKFSIYDYRWLTTNDSYALSLVLRNEEKISNSGHAIGIITQDSAQLEPPQALIGAIGSNKLVDLTIKPPHYTRVPYVRINPDDIYDDLITRWTKKQKLTSTFNPITFIKYKLHLR